jgi:S-adenosylmethionine-dependent methyltransferase
MTGNADSEQSAVERAVKALYNSDPEREWLRSQRHRTEFAVTERALSDTLPPPPARILDCGGGPGHYAIALSKQGYKVTLFDLSSDVLAYAQCRAEEAQVTLQSVEQGSATDLSRFEDDAFDAVLLMGPLYHLLKEEERLQALREAYRVVKPGAPVFVAFIARYAGHRDAAAHYPENACKNPALYDTIARTGLLPPRADERVGFVAYFAHPDEIKPLCKLAGFEVRCLLGLEGVVSVHEDKINTLQGDAWQQWVDMNYEIAHDPAILGGVEHILAVCIKPRWKSVLKEMAETLKENNITFTVVGGTSLALRGFDVPVRDLDLEMSVQDTFRFEEIYHDHSVDGVNLRENHQWRSHIGRFVIDGVNVEVMGGLCRRVGQNWVPSFLFTRSSVDLDGVSIPVLELEEEALAYLRRGRLNRVSLALPLCKADRLLELLRDAVAKNML